MIIRLEDLPTIPEISSKIIEFLQDEPEILLMSKEDVLNFLEVDYDQDLIEVLVLYTNGKPCYFDLHYYIDKNVRGVIRNINTSSSFACNLDFWRVE